MDNEIAPTFIRQNFAEIDRLAVVLIDKRATNPYERVKQRIAEARQIVAPSFQAWLRYANEPPSSREIYVTVNALRPDAQGRTKQDIAKIRHVYLDFDDNGTAGLNKLLGDKRIPEPNHVVSTSPGKWQILWRVKGFDQIAAEGLVHHLAHEFGADRAVTDSARVLRLPGFNNHKYDKPHLVTVQNLAVATYQPAQFPDWRGYQKQVEQYFADTDKLPARQARTNVGAKKQDPGETQSHRDFYYALRALTRGESVADVAARIEAYRPDKPKPSYYAEKTVTKAARYVRSNHPGISI